MVGEGGGEPAITGECRIDTDCLFSERCFDAACSPAGRDDHRGQVFVSELRVLGPGSSEVIELGSAAFPDVDIAGYRLRTAEGVDVIVRAASDPLGIAAVPLLIGQQNVVVCVWNPADAANIPAFATCLLGDPGVDADLPDESFAMSLYDRRGNLEDTVSAPLINVDRAVVADADFVLDAARSSFLDVGVGTNGAAFNDDPASWCLGRPGGQADSFGATNGFCRDTVVVNEVLYDFVAPGDSIDDGREFIELLGGPGTRLQDLGYVVGRGGVVVTGGFPGRIGRDGLLVVGDETDNGTTEVPAADLILALDLGNGSGEAGVSGASSDASVAWGTASIPALVTTSASISVARVPGSFSGDDAVDFIIDPTPTPGRENDPVTPRVLAVSPPSAPAATGATVTVDVADVLVLFGDSPRVTLIDQTVTCTIAGVLDAGRAGVQLSCVVPAHVAATGDVRVPSTASLGLSDAVLVDGWSWSAVSRGRARR